MRIEAKHHTIGPRILAGIIDLLVIIPFVVLHLVFERPGTSGGLLIILALISSAVGHFYNVYFHGRFGQTLGKMATNVKVLTVNEEPISYFQAFVRDSPYIALTLLAFGSDIFLFLPVGSDARSTENLRWDIPTALMGAFVIADVFVTLANPKRRSLHDLIARTVVVRTNA
jgi:uncharacterized RDD family membrane protein YckC